MLINQPLVPAGWPGAETCPNLEQWKGVRGRGFPPYSIGAKQARLQMSLWCVPLSAKLAVVLSAPLYGNASITAFA